MAEPVRHIFGTDVQILALTPQSANWFERAFYYPDDKDYFYQIVGGILKRFIGSNINVEGLGVTLNGFIISGIKYHIEENDILIIPDKFEYNATSLEVDGVIEVEGRLNLIEYYGTN